MSGRLMSSKMRSGWWVRAKSSPKPGAMALISRTSGSMPSTLSINCKLLGLSSMHKTVRAGHADGAAHQCHEALAECQPDPGAFDLLNISAQALEGHEQAPLLVGIEARPGVGD